PSAAADVVDARRVRAFVVGALEQAAERGSTLQPQDWVIQTVRDSAATTKCPLSIDALNVVEDTFGPVIEKIEFENGAQGYQLDRYGASRRIINQAIERRLKGRRHDGSYDWRGKLDSVLGPSSPGEDAVKEERARQEKTAA